VGSSKTLDTIQPHPRQYLEATKMIPTRDRENHSPRFNPPCPSCGSNKAKKGFTKLVCFECGCVSKLKDALKDALDKKIVIKRCGCYHKIPKAQPKPVKRIRRGRGKNKEPVAFMNWDTKNAGY
jgi:transcription initiation factor TFIIIB Brf1 subunit/transcription initiation factor TFIIB